MELMAWKQGSWQRNGAQGCDHLAPGMILNRLSTFKLTEARRFNLQLPGYISLRRNGFPWRPPPGCHNRSNADDEGPQKRVRELQRCRINKSNIQNALAEVVPEKGGVLKGAVWDRLH